MNTLHATLRSMRTRTYVRLACLAVALATPAAAWALPDNLSGGIQINAADGTTDGRSRSSLSQRYTLNWNKRFMPYLTARAGISYDRFGTELGDVGSAWRRQIQPVAELGWDHPLFTAAVTVLHHESTSQDEHTSLVRQSLGVSFRTRPVQYPVLTLRYDSDLSYNGYDRSQRDTRERRFQSGLSYNLSGHNLFYSFTNRDSDVRSEDTQLGERTHLFRWDQVTHLLASRVRLTTGYNFSHRRQTNRRDDSTITLRPIPLVAALYAEDATPEFGPLDSLRTLTDGNVADQTLPAIDIGQNSRDQNLGVDFGFSRVVRGLYVYTDRPSGGGVTWTVYLSADNLDWQRLTDAVEVTYNTSFSRYEILFAPVRTRYIKAVLGGLNDVLTVLVTELEALEESEPGEETRTQITHQADAGITVTVTDELQTGFDMHYRTEPASDFGDSRDQLFYGASIRHTPSTVIMQSADYLAGWEEFQGGLSRLSTTSLSYAIMATPLQTLKFTLSGVTLRSNENGSQQQETNSAQLRSTGAILRDLNVSFDLGFSRLNQIPTNQTFDAWTYRAGVDAGIMRWLDVVTTYLYQTNRERQTGLLRTRRQVTVNTTLQLSRSILLRGMVARAEDDDRDHTSQEYTGVWRLSPKTGLSVLMSRDDGSQGARARRWSILLNHKLSSRTTVTASYMKTEIGNNGERTTNAFQIGLRTGF